MRSFLRSSRLLLCFLFLALNIAFQLLFFSMSGIWAPTLDHVDHSSVQQKACLCPETAERDKAVEEPPLCAVPPNEERTTKNTKQDSSHYLLYVLVLTSVSGRERRDAARQTWMEGIKQLEHPVLVKFVIGTQGLSAELVNSLNSEQDTFGDILLLPNLHEAYSNLSRKVLDSFVHSVNLFTFSYLLKCDDDSFVRLDKIVEELSVRDSSKSFYWGFFDGRAHVKNKGKWTEGEWFLCDRYLPYALGGGYVLSVDLVKRLTTASKGLELYNSEDVSVGVWLSPYKAERKHDVRFNTEFVSRGCRNVYIVSHKQSIEDMRLKYRTLKESGVQCEKEYQTRLSYEYNWMVPPTSCCERRKGIP